MAPKFLQLFIPRKGKGTDNVDDLDINWRAIEQWANQLPAGFPTPGSFYASLTGPGETHSPGALTQNGDLTVDGTHTINGVLVINSGPGGTSTIDGDLLVSGPNAGGVGFEVTTFTAEVGNNTPPGGGHISMTLITPGVGPDHADGYMLGDRLAFFDVTTAVPQPATPTTLSDVITGLRALGLFA